MKVLMLGWEFPPFISGGLGTACYGLTKGMSEIGTEVLFVLPKPVDSQYTTHVKLLTPMVRRKVPRAKGPAAGSESSAAPPPSDSTPFGSAPAGYATTPSPARTIPNMPPPPPPLYEQIDHVRIETVDAGGTVSAYDRPEDQIRRVREHREYVRAMAARAAEGLRSSGVELPAHHQDNPLPGPAAPPAATAAEFDEITEYLVEPFSDSGHYGHDMFHEIERYARLAAAIATREQFDLIHAHDWMTYRAGIAASALSGKPLVVHVHSTEFDRSGIHVNQQIYDIERQGMHFAAKVICVSHLTGNICINRYGLDPAKVEVVYNAVDFNGTKPPVSLPAIRHDEKIVLFLGRITMQKGPAYFLQAAQKVLEVMPNVRFIMAGSGDMIRSSIEMAAGLGIGHRILFTGFLRGDDVERVFRMADLYVMPSVSEPFGIAPLEAMSNDVPVLISKQSGVCEVLDHALKVDFWDINEMANKIIAVLRHPPLQRTLREHGSIEVRKLSWADSARNCVDVYQKALHRQ